MIKFNWPSPAKALFTINCLFIIAVFIYGFWPGAYRPVIDKSYLSYYNGRSLKLRGRVCEEADLDYKSRRLTICVNGDISGQVLLTTELYPSYDYGDFLDINGVLKAPPLIEDFDYASYLARYDIFSVMYYPKISRAEGVLTWGQSLYRFLLDFKQFLKRQIDFSLPEPEAGLADALLLGYRRTVERSNLDMFARVGLSHMIAISGSHITIISAMILNFLLFLGWSRRQALQAIFIFLILYPLITGLSASATRSAIMGALAFLAVYHGRLSSSIKALVLAGAIMLFFNPRLLRNDIGFQLSFLVLLGIIYIYPLFQMISARCLEKIKFKRLVKRLIETLVETINLSLVSQIVILPIAAIEFKQISLIAPLANVLVLWSFAPLLASLIGGVVISWPAFYLACPGFSVLGFFPSYLLLKFIFIISSLLSSLSWAALPVTGFDWIWGGGYYLILIISVVIIRKKITLTDRTSNFFITKNR